MKKWKHYNSGPTFPTTAKANNAFFTKVDFHFVINYDIIITQLYKVNI